MPDCVLVRRTPAGFRTIAPAEAAAVQSAFFPPLDDPDWLFEQCRRIATSLAGGETALAQIYGLRIPLGELDDEALRRLAMASRLIKANFDPNQPRVPKGEPGAGQWTYEPGYAKPRQRGHADENPLLTPAGDEQSPETDGNWGEPSIPSERPATAQERNSIVRRTAAWLRQAAALGVAYAPERRVKYVLLAIEATAWIVEYLPEIRSYYLDGPKSLAELQDAVDDPQPGYEIHHIVEGLYGSVSELSNVRLFGRRLEAHENLVRIPKWAHVEISTWYSTPNREEFGGNTPRGFLRGKNWDDQYELGIQKLRDFGVLK
jgi:hypothetical protein